MAIVLPIGITGFHTQNASPRNNTDEKGFLTDCYLVARNLSASVVPEFPQSLSVASNFSYVTIRNHTCFNAVAINKHYPYIAFARVPNDNDLLLEFEHIHELTLEFRKLRKYHVLNMDELLSVVTTESISKLSSGEKNQIEYWKPSCLGHVIYNSWD